MGYKLKGLPEKVFWQDTKQFTVIDDEGKEIEVRVSESSKNYEYFMWYEPGGWDEIEDDDLIMYLQEEFGDDEYVFESEQRKEEESKIDIEYDKFIQENGEIQEIKQFVKLVDRVMGLMDFKKDYYERVYLSYQYAKKKLKV